MALLAFRTDGNGVFLFAGFGLLFGVPFVAVLIKVVSRIGSPTDGTEEGMEAESSPTSFAPHWFVMTAVIGSAILILALILIPIFLK